METRASLLILICLGVGCAHFIPGGLSSTQAVVRAEAFVRDNGYTDAPSVSADRLEPESLEELGRPEAEGHVRRHRQRHTLRYRFAIPSI